MSSSQIYMAITSAWKMEGGAPRSSLIALPPIPQDSNACAVARLPDIDKLAGGSPFQFADFDFGNFSVRYIYILFTNETEKGARSYPHGQWYRLFVVVKDAGMVYGFAGKSFATTTFFIL